MDEEKLSTEDLQRAFPLAPRGAAVPEGVRDGDVIIDQHGNTLKVMELHAVMRDPKDGRLFGGPSIGFYTVPVESGSTAEVSDKAEDAES